MAISGTITLGTDTTSNMTSFDLYPCTSSSNSSCSGTAFETNVSRASLIGGLQTNNIPDGTLYIKINATDGPCKDSNPVIIELSGAPLQVSLSPTPTLTKTPTQTPTPTTQGVTITNCVRLVKNRPMIQPDCSTTRIQRVTVTLYDSTGANVENATYDITVTLGGTGDDNEPMTWDLTIPSGESSVYDDIVVAEQTSGECNERDNTAVLRVISAISSISPPNIGVCTSTLPPPQGTVLLPFYYGQGRPTSDEHCGTNYIINASFFATGTTISGLYGQTIYTTNTGSAAFDGLGSWFPVALVNTTTTEFGQYYVIKIDSNGAVQDIRFMGNCGSSVPL